MYLQVSPTKEEVTVSSVDVLKEVLATKKIMLGMANRLEKI